MNIFGLQLDLPSLLIGVASTGVFSLIMGILIRKLLLGDRVLKFLADHVDELVDSVQKRDNVSGKALRDRLIALAEKIIKELKAPD